MLSSKPSADEILIRGAVDADVDAIARTWHAAWRDGHVGHVPEELLRHRDAEQFRTRAAARIPSTSVAEVDRVVVGFVAIHDDELEQLFVDRGARGTGIAGRLLRHGEAAIRAAGHRTAWLAVVAGNARARAFYARMGWQDRGVMDYQAEIPGGSLTLAVHRYEIDLTPIG